MSKKEIVVKFNKITKNLLQDMKHIIGSSYFYNFCIIIRFNSTLPISKFKLNILKYKDYILNKNADYFNNENIIIEEINNDEELSSDREYYLNEYRNFKNIYFSIDDESKDNLWDILQVLVHLCETYHNSEFM